MKTKIGDKLLGIRENRRLSQVEMAELLDIPSTTYARYERNESNIDFERIVHFANKLNVPVQELYPETMSITNNNNNSGQGGGVIFGNQYFYFSENETIQALKKEIEELKKKLNDQSNNLNNN